MQPQFSARDRIIRARVHLQTENPFFSYLVMNLQLKEFPKELSHLKKNDELTMAVDSFGNMYYGENFIKKLTDKQIKSVICHEVLHVAFEHLNRVNNRIFDLWNVATDLVINDVLVSNGFSMPRGLIPSNHEYKDKSMKNPITDLDKKPAERVYEELFNQIPKKDQAILSAMGFDSHIYSDKKSDGKDLSPKEKEEVAKAVRQWKNLLIEATTYAKLRGTLPAGMERLVEGLTQSKMNWKSLLYRYITNEIPFDYSYSYPSKRSQSLGIYMPHIRKERIGICVAIDTSGSIGQEELTEFLSEMIGIAKSFNNIKMTAIICDAEVHDVLVFENGNIDTIAQTKIKGGGGTSHIPVYKYIEENMPQTKILINFTDGYTQFNPEETVKTIWAISTGGIQTEQIPYGIVVRLGE